MSKQNGRGELREVPPNPVKIKGTLKRFNFVAGDEGTAVSTIDEQKGYITQWALNGECLLVQWADGKGSVIPVARIVSFETDVEEQRIVVPQIVPGPPPGEKR